MSLSDAWVQELGDVELSYLYRILNRAIEADETTSGYPRLRSKGEQDIAWDVKNEFLVRAVSSEAHVWLTREEW